MIGLEAREYVSIHAPREGCDGSFPLYCYSITVSIHAPREGCDSDVPTDELEQMSFNSRTPGGVRPGTFLTRYMPSKFQFTHPGRGATRRYPGTRQGWEVSIHAPREGCDIDERQDWEQRKVSIHAPREGCDQSSSMASLLPSSFNSRTPGGVRPRAGYA